MKLDYVPATGNFVLWVDRGSVDIATLMRDHGLDFSATASTPEMAALFTPHVYAAFAFRGVATIRATAALEAVLSEIEASFAPSGSGSYPVPPGQELWPFQVASLDYAIRRSRCLVADEPGLGKTPIAITYANAIEAQRTLVICPASIRLQWANRIREWSTQRWPSTIHTIMSGKSGVHPTAAWNIVSYDLARTPAIGKALARQSYDLLILDEAHYLKTSDTKRSRAIFGGGLSSPFGPIADKATRVLALSGTPLPNRPRECYTLARNLCWDAVDWMGERQFQERFNPSAVRTTPDGKIFVDERAGRAPELYARMRAHFMVRHLKRDVMPQLKMPSFDVIQVEETSAIKMALEAERLLDIDPEEFEGRMSGPILGHIAAVRRQMGIAMAPQALEYIETILVGGETKLVVFAWHIEVLDILEKGLKRWGVRRVDGSTSSPQKEKHVEDFIANPGIKVILGNILSLGTGTDGLQKVCNHGIIVEPDWVPGNNVQAFDRLDRGGQERQVQGDVLVAPGSIMDRVLSSALRKGRNIHQVLDAP